MTITLQEANKQGPNSGASPFVRGSGIGARTESGGQKRKVSEVELSSPPPMKRVRPSSPRRAPSVGPRIDNYRSSTDSVGQLASSSSSILFEGSFTRHTSHTNMLSPSTTVSDLDEQSTMSSNSTPTKMARIPRPANSFILFRSHYCKRYMPSEPASQTNISAVTGQYTALIRISSREFIERIDKVLRGNSFRGKRKIFGNKGRTRQKNNTCVITPTIATDHITATRRPSQRLKESDHKGTFSGLGILSHWLQFKITSLSSKVLWGEYGHLPLSKYRGACHMDGFSTITFYSAGHPALALPCMRTRWMSV